MNELLQRSGQFHDALFASLGTGARLFDESPRLRASLGACQLSIEHSTVLRLAFASQAPHSGVALLRLQYEALLRAAWLLHAASESEILKLTEPLNPTSEQGAKNVAGASDMLKALGSKASASLVQPLQGFDEVSRKALNSFVHSGLHALHRVALGFPLILAQQVIRNSNGLAHMAYRLVATLSGDPAQIDRTTQTYHLFEDCLPTTGR